MDSEESKFARWLTRLGGEIPPRPEHQRQLRQQVLDVFDRESTDHGGRSLPVMHRNDWRWIMRQRGLRWASAAAVLLVIMGITAWFLGGGTRVALADLLQPILDAKNAKFKQQSQGAPQPVIADVMVQGSRMRTEIPGDIRQIIIVDFEQGKTLFLAPDLKQATLTTYINTPKDSAPKNFLAKLQSDLLNLRDDPNVKRESLGTQVLDGQRAVGYRLLSNNVTLELWGNPETALPIQVVLCAPSDPESKTTMSDFVFNVDLDESLFSLDPPAGYSLNKTQVDATPAQEADLINTLRRFPELSGGTTFPDTLTLPQYSELVQKRWQKNESLSSQQQLDELFKYTNGFGFLEQLPADADVHYAGKGVALNAPDTPICWYRPKGSKSYRVIYADLTVRDAETPPNVPNAQLRLPAPTK